MTKREEKTCATCAAPITWADEFPGGLCLACYKRTPAAKAPIDAKALADAFGATLRR